MIKFRDVLELIGDTCIVCFGIWSLVTFINILTHGHITYIEPASAILIGETILAGIIIPFGIERTIDDMRGFVRKRK